MILGHLIRGINQAERQGCRLWRDGQRCWQRLSCRLGTEDLNLQKHTTK